MNTPQYTREIKRFPRTFRETTPLDPTPPERNLKTLEEVHFSSVQQAEQRNNEESMERRGALGDSINWDRESSQRVLTERLLVTLSAHRFLPLARGLLYLFKFKGL